MELKRRLTAFYAEKFALPKEQIENYFKSYQIDVQQLDKFTELLDKI
jgi:xanthine dehydrogenase molybdopterin-binding subunit B